MGFQDMDLSGRARAAHPFRGNSPADGHGQWGLRWGLLEQLLELQQLLLLLQLLLELLLLQLLELLLLLVEHGGWGKEGEKGWEPQHNAVQLSSRPRSSTHSNPGPSNSSS